VRVQLDAEEDAIPIEASLADAVGDVFRYSDEPRGDGALEVQLQNAIESPITIPSAPEVEFFPENPGSGESAVATVDAIRLGDTDTRAFPVDVLPGQAAHLSVSAVDGAAVPSGALDAVFDWSHLVVRPDGDALWEHVIDATVPAQYSHTVTVQTFAEVLGGDDGPGAIIVEFLDGRDTVIASAVLSSEDSGEEASTIETTIEIELPVRDYVLASTSGSAAESVIRYRARTPDGGTGPVQEEGAGKSRIVIFANHLPGA
jgi:hypothetical protein